MKFLDLLIKILSLKGYSSKMKIIWVDEDGSEVEIGGAIVEQGKIKIFSEYTKGEAGL